MSSRVLRYVYRRDKSAEARERLTNIRGVGDTLLFVSKTEAFDRVPLREPTHANVLVPVGGNDVRLIRGEDECGKEGRMP